MNDRLISRLCAAGAAATLLAIAGSAWAWPWEARPGARRLQDDRTFTVSAEFSGYMKGDIMVNGTLYRLAPGTMVYVVGEGARPLGFTVSRRSVFLAGEWQDRVPVVHSVVVRPAAAAADAEAPGVLDPRTPR